MGILREEPGRILVHSVQDHVVGITQTTSPHPDPRPTTVSPLRTRSDGLTVAPPCGMNQARPNYVSIPKVENKKAGFGGDRTSDPVNYKPRPVPLHYGVNTACLYLENTAN